MGDGEELNRMGACAGAVDLDVTSLRSCNALPRVKRTDVVSPRCTHENGTKPLTYTPFQSSTRSIQAGVLLHRRAA